MSSHPNISPPATYVVAGQWPDGSVDGPRVVLYAQAFAQALVVARGERSIREVARQADLSHSTLLAVLRGERWPDMITIAKLEEALRVGLWPGERLRGSSDV